MPIFAPIPPVGWTPFLPAESGLAPNTVLGRFTNEESVAFGYTHDILRTFKGTPGAFVQNVSGIWTVQIVEDETSSARVLFDQSVQVEILVFSASDPFFSTGAGIYFYLFIDNGSGVGEFKTRLVNGVFVPPVIEPRLPIEIPPPPVAPSPGDPGVPFFFDERTTTIQVHMPDALPARCASLTLLASDNRFTGFVPVASGLQAGQNVTVSAGSVGQARIEHVWFKLRAVANSALGGVGYTEGAAVRDTWAEWLQNADGSWTQTAGYAGWQHVHSFSSQPPSATPYTETGSGFSDASVTFSLGGSIIGLWASPYYDCAFPEGAIWKVRSDGWAPALSTNDRFTFAISSLAGDSSFETLHDSLTGQTWAFYREGKELKCTRTRKPREALLFNGLDSVISAEAPTKWTPLRSGSTLLVPLTIGNVSKLQLATNRDDGTGLGGAAFEGEGWHIMSLVTGVKQLGSVLNSDGSVLYIFAQATQAIDVGSVHAATKDAQGVETSPPVPALTIGDGDYVRVVVKRSSGAGSSAGWSVAALDTIGGSLPIIGNKVDLLLNGSTFRLMPAKKAGVEVAISTDEMKTFTLAGAVVGS